MILIISYGLSYLFTFTSSILETTYETALKYQYINLYHYCASKNFTSNPLVTRPKIVCLLSSQGVGAVVMKNLTIKNIYNKNNEKDLKLKFSKTEETNNVK